MNIGRRLAIIRNSRGLTIKEVADKCGKSTYDRVELGKAEVKFSELLKICEVLKIEIWQLTAKKLVVKYEEGLEMPF